jgi:DNA-binding NtrC family response regulator
VRVTVIDRGSVVGQSVRRVLGCNAAPVIILRSLQDLEPALHAGDHPDVLIVNIAGDLTGWELASRVRRFRYEGQVLALVDSPAAPGVKYLTQLPRAHCVARPASAQALDDLLSKAMCESLLHEVELVPPPPVRRAYHGIVGHSPQMLEIFSRIEKVAAGDANVCVYGESGTGKELIARAIHYASRRGDRPLVTLDCTTIPEGLMESHLLGHVKGAFTGAVDHRDGVFSLAHTGTLFIDELCELSLPLQAKLLRVIQSREFVRVGGTKPIRTDVRLITATNRDPKLQVEAGRFREDLYYRVAVFMIRVPPLRERPEDIPLLVDHFLRRFADTYGKAFTAVEPGAMKRLADLPWPGNVRQLENFLEQAVVLADEEVLTERVLFAAEPPASRVSTQDAGGVSEPVLSLREVERRHILRTLQRVKGNRTEAARLLGIGIRTLQYKLKVYRQESDVPFGLTR